MNEQYHFDVTLNDGRIAHCFEAESQEYSGNNTKFSAGLVEGIAPDTLYLRLERGGDDPTFLFFRPDEMAAVIRCAAGALWSLQLFELDGEKYG